MVERMRHNILQMNHSIKVSCSTESLKKVRNFLGRVLSDHAVLDEEANLMVLAVDEICANLIIHANNSDKKKALEIKIRNTPEGFIFEILDKSTPFDHTLVSDPDLSTIIHQKKKGGIGLMLVKRIMDSFEFGKEGHYTIYRLFKKMKIA